MNTHTHEHIHTHARARTHTHTDLKDLKSQNMHVTHAFRMPFDLSHEHTCTVETYYTPTLPYTDMHIVQS